MAVPTFTIYNGTSASTSHTIPLPAGRAGARVFIFLAPASGPVFNGNGSTWNVVTAGGLLGGLYWRDCTGAEANPSVTFGGAQQFRAATAMLAGGSYFGAPVVNAVPPNSIDPPAVATNSGNGTVIAFTGWTHTTTCNLSSNPAGYSAGTSGNGTASIPGLAVAYKSVAPAAASENPGTFALSASPTVFSSNTIFQASTLIPTLHTNTQQFGGDDGVSNFTPPALDASCFTFGQSPSANTSHVVPLPADLNGKRIIIAFTGLGTAVASIVFPAGWTEIDTTSNANERQEIFYRDCDGSEGASLTITTATSILASWGVVEFPKGSYDKTQAPVGSATTSTSTLTPNPPSLNSGAGLSFSRGAYWLSSFGQRGVATPPTLTDAPAGFTLRGSALGPNVYGTAWADKVDNVQTLDPGTWTTTGTATNQSTSTIAVKAAAPVATLIFRTAATPYPAPFHQNTQTFYGPKLTVKYAAPLHTAAQEFYGPKIRAGLTVTFHTNVQQFFGPKLRALIKVPLYTNAQAFYGPSILLAAPPNVLKPALHTAAQAFYGPTLAFNLRLSVPFHTASQTFYGPTIYRLQKLVAPFHVNAQEFYDAGIARLGKIAVPFHQNVPVFYGPRIVTPRFLTPTLHQNVPVFYGPTLRFGMVVAAPFHQSAQAFYGPKLRMTLKLSARFDNAQQFFSPRIRLGLGAPFHTNVQAFFGPTLRTAANLRPTLHVNAQQFFGPTIKTPRFLQPTFHQNVPVIYAPRILFFMQPIPPEPPSGISAIGPFVWSEGIREKRKKIEREKDLEWNIKSAAEITSSAPPWNPVVVTPELDRRAKRATKAWMDHVKAIRAKQLKRDDEIDNQIIRTVIRILKE